MLKKVYNVFSKNSEREKVISKYSERETTKRWNRAFCFFYNFLCYNIYKGDLMKKTKQGDKAEELFRDDTCINCWEWYEHCTCRPIKFENQNLEVIQETDPEGMWSFLDFELNGHLIMQSHTMFKNVAKDEMNEAKQVFARDVKKHIKTINDRKPCKNKVCDRVKRYAVENTKKLILFRGYYAKYEISKMEEKWVTTTVK